MVLTVGHTAAAHRRHSCRNESLDSMPRIAMFCTFCWIKAENLHKVNPRGFTQRPLALVETDPEHQIKSNLGKQAHFHQKISGIFESSCDGVVPSTASTFQNLLLHLNATSSVTFSSFFCGWQSKVVKYFIRSVFHIWTHCTFFQRQISALRWTKVKVVFAQPFVIVNFLANTVTVCSEQCQWPSV